MAGSGTAFYTLILSSVLCLWLPSCHFPCISDTTVNWDPRRDQMLKRVIFLPSACYLTCDFVSCSCVYLRESSICNWLTRQKAQRPGKSKVGRKQGPHCRKQIWTDERLGEQRNGRRDGCKKEEKTYEQFDGTRLDVWLDRWLSEWMVDGWKKRWKYEYMNGRMSW
jgi:hypothetical protein